MKIILNIQRFNPETHTEPYMEKHEIEVDPTDRILDALMHVKQYRDGSLGFRKSCAHGVWRIGRDADQRKGPPGLQDPCAGCC